MSNANIVQLTIYDGITVFEAILSINKHVVRCDHTGTHCKMKINQKENDTSR